MTTGGFISNMPTNQFGMSKSPDFLSAMREAGFQTSGWVGVCGVSLVLLFLPCWCVYDGNTFYLVAMTHNYGNWRVYNFGDGYSGSCCWFLLMPHCQFVVSLSIW